MGEGKRSIGSRIQLKARYEEVEPCGTPLSGREDSFHFVYQEYSGDTVLTARVMNLEGGLSGAQVGVMLRESLDADARYVAMTVRSTTSSEQFRLNYRNSKGGRTRSKSEPRGVQLPNAWVRMERQGDELIGSVSTDGTTWEEVYRKTIAGFPERYYGGVFAAGGEPRDASSFEALRAEIAGLEFPEAAVRFLRGDCNDDGNVDLADAVCGLNWLFAGAATPGCVAALNTNGDATVDITDPVSLLNFLFAGGPSVVAPFPECGPGSSAADKELGCVNSNCL